MIRALPLVLTGFLCGCSVLAYTPVIGASAIGRDRVAVTPEHEAVPLIGQAITVPSHSPLTLRRFDNGRLFLAYSDVVTTGTERLCRLAGQELVIADVYEDRINGGTFFDAVVSCGGTQHEVTRTLWSQSILTWSTT